MLLMMFITESSNSSRPLGFSKLLINSLRGVPASSACLASSSIALASSAVKPILSSSAADSSPITDVSSSAVMVVSDQFFPLRSQTLLTSFWTAMLSYPASVRALIRSAPLPKSPLITFPTTVLNSSSFPETSVVTFDVSFREPVKRLSVSMIKLGLSAPAWNAFARDPCFLIRSSIAIPWSFAV